MILLHFWDKWWWKYILYPKDSQHDWWTVIWCRIRNHPDGIWYYNPNGLEPDMHCKNCGDDLG